MNGQSKIYVGYTMPSHLSVVQQMTSAKKLAGGPALQAMLQGSKPVFPGGAPAWYPQFSNAVYTNLHAAATGSITVDEAIKKISDTANQLAGS